MGQLYSKNKSIVRKAENPLDKFQHIATRILNAQQLHYFNGTTVIYKIWQEEGGVKNGQFCIYVADSVVVLLREWKSCLHHIQRKEALLHFQQVYFEPKGTSKRKSCVTELELVACSAFLWMLWSTSLPKPLSRRFFF